MTLPTPRLEAGLSFPGVVLFGAYQICVDGVTPLLELLLCGWLPPLLPLMSLGSKTMRPAEAALL